VSDIFWDSTKNTQLELINKLSSLKYNFITRWKSTLTDIIINHSKHIFAGSIFIEAELYNISKCFTWLKILVTKHFNGYIHNYIVYATRRKDYKTLLYNVYNDKSIYWGIEFINLVLKCHDINCDRTIDMLSYVDDNGDTIIHKMAARHDKLLLYPIIDTFSDKLKIKPNIAGMTPATLYDNNKLVNKLSRLCDN
jgi:hypothetical protein